jgi:hypothetical protein
MPTPTLRVSQFLTAVAMTAAMLVPLAHAETERPGTERWTVKIGSDAGAADTRVVRNNPIGELARLVALPRPVRLPAARRLAAERGVYTVAATVVQYKLEGDGDYHVVLRDGNQTMIAEIPEPAFCKESHWHEQITTARQEFSARYKASNRFRYVNAPALVTGVLFFDFPHGQAGVAPNAVELHPVLAITWSGKASTGYQPALSPRRAARTHRTRHSGHTTHTTAPAAGGVQVWVNTKTGVYHYPGTRWYGNTKEGEYMPESKARAEGDRPAENGQ